MASRLKHLREARGICQWDLANQVGLSSGALSLIESGRRQPSGVVAAMLAAIFGLAVGEIFPGMQQEGNRHAEE